MEQEIQGVQVNLLRYDETKNPNGFKAYTYRTRSYGIKKVDEFTIWKAKRVANATSHYNRYYKEFSFQDEGNCDSNKTINPNIHVWWKRSVVLKKPSMLNKSKFSIMLTLNEKIVIDSFTKEDENGELQSVKLDGQLFEDTVLKRFERCIQHEHEAGRQDQPLLFDGAMVHIGRSYKWLAERNLQLSIV